MAVTVFRGRRAGPHLGDSHISGTDAKLKEVFSKGQLPSKRLLHWIAPGPEIPTVDTPLNEVTGGPQTGGCVTWWVTHHHLERANRPRASGRPKGKLGESVKWGLGESEAANNHSMLARLCLVPKTDICGSNHVWKLVVNFYKIIQV